MGVKDTLPNFKSFTFDGVNSRDYGVYITGEGVFNAPERNVEMIDIPGRNGAFALDRGNFNNIEITYPAGIFADTEADFADAVSDLRNFLCSKVGYVRLEDDYNTGEYRLAIYKSGLEVSHDMLTNGEFDIVFECKPQRYLTSGETAVAVASGGTLTNPTLFPSHPMLEVKGYGAIDIGGQSITVENVPIGDVVVHNTETIRSNTGTITFDDTYANSGDSILLDSTMLGVEIYSTDGSITGVSNSASGAITSAGFYQSGGFVVVRQSMDAKQFSYGTSSTLTGTATYVVNHSVYGNITGTISITLSYDGTNGISLTGTYTMPTHLIEIQNVSFPYVKIGDITLSSTQSALGNPMYIDLDIGECYKIESNSVVSVNNSVQIPAELPTLASGANTITYDNTFTQFKVVPRWWKV